MYIYAGLLTVTLHTLYKFDGKFSPLCITCSTNQFPHHPRQIGRVWMTQCAQPSWRVSLLTQLLLACNQRSMTVYFERCCTALKIYM